MDLTGWDTVILTRRPPRKVFRRVRAAVLARWPAALADDLDDPKSDPEPLKAVRGGKLPARAWHLLFHRDAAMVAHMDQAAYVPMADGDGPFAVIARPRRGVEFRIDRLHELRAAGEPAGRKVEPYSAWLCTPLIFEVTVVTPADPQSHPFSAWACETVRQACGGWV